MKNRKERKIEYCTFLAYFVVVALFVVLRICSHYNLFSFMGQYASFYMSLITQVGIILLVPLIIFKYLTNARMKDVVAFYGFKKINFKTILWAILLGVVVFVMNIYVSNFFNNIIQYFGYKPLSGGSTMPASWGMFFANLFCTAVLPAICEEVLHRGMLLRGASKLGVKKAIMISGLLFGLLHLNIEQFFYATIIGFFLGYLTLGCDSIYPAMIVHFMNNGISVFLQFARAKGWAIGNVFSYLGEFLSNNYVIGIVILILLFILLYLLLGEISRKIFMESFKTDFEKQQKNIQNQAMRQKYFGQIEEIKSGKSQGVYGGQDQRIIVDLKEFFEFVQSNIDGIVDSMDEQNPPAPTMDTKTKIFMLGSIALSTIVTIMTFIWGIL